MGPSSRFTRVAATAAQPVVSKPTAPPQLRVTKVNQLVEKNSRLLVKICELLVS